MSVPEPRYDAHVARTLAPYPDATLVDYLDELARTHPSRTALHFKGATITYGVLGALSEAFAAALAARGLRRGDRVALLLPNCPQFLIAQFGIWKAGGVVTPLNPTYSEHELAELLEGTRAECAVVLTPFYDKVRRAQGRTRVRRIIATSIKEYLPPLLRTLFTWFKEKQDGHRIALASGDEWFGDLIAAHRAAQHGVPRPGPDDPAVILSTGGTTGTPKGAVGRHRHYVASGRQIDAWTSSIRKPWQDVIMLPLPLFHVYANLGVLPMAFLGPNPVSLIPNPRDLDDVLKTIRQVKPGFFSGVPTLYAAMVNHPKVRSGKVSLRSIKLCVSGASALMADTKRRFEEATGARIIEGYSLTEAMMAACLNPVEGPRKTGSVGIPLPDVEVRILDPDTGTHDVPAGEVGELVLRAPQIMAEYWNNPLETAETLRLHGPGAPWLHTGDLVYADEDGYLFVVDRKKDLVKTSGFQVWPREIEEVLSAHPAVLEVGVAGVPEPARGEVVYAWVVAKPGEMATEETLRAYCRERLAPYKVPARVIFRESLPKTMVGKILRRALVADAATTPPR